MSTSKKKRSITPPTMGDAVIIRTVTHYYTGKILLIDKDWIVLGDAAWVADTGRWNNALMTGKLAEVEPFPNGVSIARGAIIDCSPWMHGLPGYSDRDHDRDHDSDRSWPMRAMAAFTGPIGVAVAVGVAVVVAVAVGVTHALTGR